MGIKATKAQIDELVAKGGTIGPVNDYQRFDALAVNLSSPRGTHTIDIPGWRPVSLNKLMYASVHQRIRLKKADSEMVGMFCHLAGVPKAACRRRVSLTITLGPRQKQYDDDNAWKSVLDGLVTCGRLVNDNATWMERGSVTWLPRGSRQAGTEILLEDIP